MWCEIVHMLDKHNLNRNPLHNCRCFPHGWAIVLNIQLRNLVTRLRYWSKSPSKLHSFDPCNLLVFILFEFAFNPTVPTREFNLIYTTTTNHYHHYDCYYHIIIIYYWDIISSLKSWVKLFGITFFVCLF